MSELREAIDICTCIPCRGATTAAATGWLHCAECCFGLMIEEYDPNCPIAEHREWAARQYGGHR